MNTSRNNLFYSYCMISAFLSVYIAFLLTSRILLENIYVYLNYFLWNSKTVKIFRIRSKKSDRKKGGKYLPEALWLFSWWRRLEIQETKNQNHLLKKDNTLKFYRWTLACFQYAILSILVNLSKRNRAVNFLLHLQLSILHKVKTEWKCLSKNWQNWNMKSRHLQRINSKFLLGIWSKSYYYLL